ncbi:hypothetical protein EWZ79_03435 [Helicobacter pylori]|nr:hypothetical protein [Helicobacter pylori]QEF36312.1 hypothetical protein D2C77_02645 [Helicobacter pylori]
MIKIKGFYVFKLHCLKTFKSNFKIRWRIISSLNELTKRVLNNGRKFFQKCFYTTQSIFLITS